MRPTTRQQLLEINRSFYRRHAASFDRSRQAPWPGWRSLADLAGLGLPRPEPLRCLDAGCGNGRFADFLAEAVPGAVGYLGADSAEALLARAADRVDDTSAFRAFRAVELTISSALLKLTNDGPFDLVTLFGVLHHVPSEPARRQLLVDLASLLAPGGLLAASVWRLDLFPERFAKKRIPWSCAPDVDQEDLDEGDVLLGWHGDASTPRYCHFPTDDEIETLRAAPLESQVAGIRPSTQFRADGPSGADNLYLLWRRVDDAGD